MKKKIAVLLSGLMILSITGCGFSNFSGTEGTGKVTEQIIVPSDAILAQENNVISLDIGDIKVPDGYTIGSGKFTDPTTKKDFSVIGVWKTEKKEDAASTDLSETEQAAFVNYKTITDEDILFYVMYGDDNLSPDAELGISEVRTSLSTYNNYFKTLLSLNFPVIDDITKNDTNGNPVVDESGNLSARISIDKKWYYTTFTATSGQSLTTTYSTICYPKSYYGVMMLEAQQSPEHSRKYYTFVFSNNSKGEIFNKEDYYSLFSQVKKLYDLYGFYTAPQLSAEKDQSINYYNGRSFEQLNDLFKDTFNYYIIEENNSAAASSDASGSDPDND